MNQLALAPEDLQRWLRGAANRQAFHSAAPLLVDVRPPQQFNRERIHGSHNITAARLLCGEPLDQDLILIGAEPGQAETLAEALHESGFHRRIQHLQGGFSAWREAGLPLEHPAFSTTVPSLAPRVLQRPWLLSTALLGLALAVQQVQLSPALGAVLLWSVLGVLSAGLLRSGRQLLRRSA